MGCTGQVWYDTNGGYDKYFIDSLGAYKVLSDVWRIIDAVFGYRSRRESDYHL